MCTPHPTIYHNYAIFLGLEISLPEHFALIFKNHTHCIYSFSPSSQIIDSLEQEYLVLAIAIFLKLTTYLAIGRIF